MDGSVIDSLKQAHGAHPDAVFTVFTVSGHAISGRIARCGPIITLTAGKETAELSADRIEAFSYREP